MAEYWLTIDPYTFIEIKFLKGLLYNSLTSSKFIFEQEKIVKLLQSLKNRNNNYTIKLSESDLKDKDIEEFITLVKTNYIGDLIDVSNSTVKPFQFVPEPFYEKKIDQLKDYDKSSYYFIFDLPAYLHEVYIYITENCNLKCLHCNSYFKQLSFCKKGNTKSEDLEHSILLKTLYKLALHESITISIIGGNIFQYKRIDDLIEHLISIKNKIAVYIHIKNINQIDIKRLEGIENLKIIITVETINISDIEKSIKILKNNTTPFEFKFIVCDNLDIQNITNIDNLLADIEYSVEPFYNGCNTSFFKENILMDQSDIDSIKCSIKEILANQSVNSIDYGRLLIDTNGDVYGNFNFEPIGNINHDEIYDLTFKEFSKGKSWRRVRSEEPCKSCLNQFICPPLTNYEIALNQTNLCTFK